MPESLTVPLQTVGQHVGAALWAMAIFACGFGLAFVVVRFQVQSLLLFPKWLLNLARKYLRPELSPVLLFSFIFLFNSTAIFCYMASGGLVFLPIMFDLLTGLNVGAIMLEDAREAAAAPQAGPGPPARAWVGFCSLFVVIAELSAFWISIGMGMKLGHAMHGSFTWTAFEAAMAPRLLAYLVLVVPTLALSALAETAAIKAMLEVEEEEGASTDDA